MGSTGRYPTPDHPWITQIEGPLYRQVLPRRATDQELALMLSEVERITKAMTSHYGWVADISHVAFASASQRQLYANSEKRLAHLDSRYCAGTGVCCKDALTRGIVTAVLWMSPPSYPLQVFGLVAEAEQWARRQLVARGVPMSTTGLGAQRQA